MKKIHKHQSHQRDIKIVESEQEDQQVLVVTKHQEDSENFTVRWSKLRDETQQYKYFQSSKFSENARRLCYALIATSWLFVYIDHKFVYSLWHFWVSIVLCIVFLTADCIHYFVDTIMYHKEYKKFEAYTSNIDITLKHESKMNDISEGSFRFIKIKFLVLTFAVVMFFWGFVVNYLIKLTC